MKQVSIFIFAVAVSGCAKNVSPPGESKSKSERVERDTNVDLGPINRWHDRLGDTVTLTGKAVNHKIGAFLAGDGFGIYVDLPDTHWPAELYHGGDEGEVVRVTGKVVQRSDLPIFVPDPNLPAIQGIPVSKGTDMETAAKRYVLEAEKWERVERSSIDPSVGSSQ